MSERIYKQNLSYYSMKLLKLGGSVITNKKGRCEANLQNIEELAKMLAKLWENKKRDIVLVHGAGSFGHTLVIEKKLKGILDQKQQQDAIEVQKECKNLSDILILNLKKFGINAQRIAPHEIIESDCARIIKIDKEKILQLLKLGIMPVLHGDMVLDKQWKYSVCSGDQIIARLSKDAQFTILATDVDGIMAKEKLIEKIDDKNFEDIKKYLKESASPDVTGGMLGKISELKKSGGKYYIVNAKYPQRILDIFNGKKTICTEIKFST